MNDTPGWASPGSAPSDGHGPEDSGTPPTPAVPPQWSSVQPPPGQWSPPGGPPPGPGAPPPPPPGWGAPGRPPVWGRPPAAKPGVIPLRPLAVGEILDGAVSTLRIHWRTVLGVTVAVAVLAQICNILVERFLLPAPARFDPDATPAQEMNQAMDAARSSLLSTVPTAAIALISTLLITSVLTVVISRSVLGRPVTLADAWQEARPRLLPLLGLTLLIPLMTAAVIAVGVGLGALTGNTGVLVLFLLASVVVAVWLVILFELAAPALMLERQGAIQSLRRSAKLVRGSWWRTFGILVLTWLLIILVTIVISIPFGLIGLAVDGGSLGNLLSGNTPDYGWPYLIITGIGAVIGSAITYPISAGVTALLYVDQRIRREALDLELARAAGISAHGPGPAGS